MFDLSNFNLNFNYSDLSEIIVINGSKILLALIILYFGFKIINKLTHILNKRLLKKSYDPMIINFTIPMVRIGAKIFLALPLINFIGIETTSFIAAIGGASFAVGLAFQGSLSNFAGGVLLLILKPFSVGHFIEVGSHKGTVQSISIFYTYLQTFDNKIIVIPNSNVSNDSLINYTANDKRRIDYNIGVDYDTDIDYVKEVLGEVINNESGILDMPEPIIGLGEYAASSIVFHIKVWVSTEDYWKVFYRFNENIKRAFNKKGISFPYPHMDVNIYKDIKNNIKEN
ncbi:MAG TPA: mechanosensitive ion channel domain-containing protein [Clostridia bacterium]|nr:mechanosensitive ion channel domain-containing protein [Clostridia bacterium]